MTTRRWLYRSLAVAMATALLAGCADGKRIAAENDRLRDRVVELEKRIEQLSGESAELRAELQRASAAPDSLPEEIRANTPHVARISISRLSHARDENDDGRADTLVLYVKPADGLGRFVQMVGHLSVHAALLPADADAITIGRLTLGPHEVRQAYRSTFTGTHYTVTVPIVVADGLDEGSCIVGIEYLDGRTGLRCVDERAIGLSRPAAPHRTQGQ